MRNGFTLVEVLVVVVILAILAAILFPVFGIAREKGRQAACMNNQRQIATTALMYAQDHDEKLPPAASFWEALGLPQAVLQCPTVGRAVANAYVCNNGIAGVALGDIDDPVTTIVSADGRHDAGHPAGTYDGVAYQLPDIEKRHRGQFIASYADGHVERTAAVSWLSGPPGHPDLPHYNDVMAWYAADYATQVSAGTVNGWGSWAWTGGQALPGDPDHKPTFVPSVPTLNGQPALDFSPPVGTWNALVTNDIGDNWTSNEGTIFIVFQPAGNNDQYEYTVLDQTNGDTDQATRVKSSGGGSPMPPAAAPGANPNPQIVTFTASSNAVNLNDTVTLTWTSTNANSASGTGFSPAGPNGSTTITMATAGHIPLTLTVFNASKPQTKDTRTIYIDVAAPAQPQITRFDAAPATVNVGESVTLTWTSNNADTASGIGFSPSGPNGTTTVIMGAIGHIALTLNVYKASNPGQQATQTIYVDVNPTPPAVTLTASKTSLTAGESVHLHWAATNATEVDAQTNLGAHRWDLTGDLDDTPSATIVYSITVKDGLNRTASASVTVTVSGGGGSSSGGKVSLFRRTAATNYPPDNVPYNTPTCWSIVSGKTGYTIYQRGVPWPAYAGGPDWRTPARLWIGGTEHGSNAKRKSFDGYIAEIIVFRTALSDADRQRVEQYLAMKYGL